MACPGRFVIGVELIIPAWITAFVAFEIGLKQKGIEEPGGVSKVPFRRTCIGHALKAEIFRFEGCNQRFTSLTHCQEQVQHEETVLLIPICAPKHHGRMDLVIEKLLVTEGH